MWWFCTSRCCVKLSGARGPTDCCVVGASRPCCGHLPPAPGHNLPAGLENCGGASGNKANDLMTAEEARASSHEAGREGGRLLACISTGLKPPFIKLKQRCQMLDDAEHYFKTLLLYTPTHPSPPHSGSLTVL